MTICRTVAFAALLGLAGAGLGCSQPAAVLPTDQKAKDLAAQPPPPILGMNGGPAAPGNHNVTNTNSTKPAPGKSKLHGISK